MAARYQWDQLLAYALGEECSGNLKERHRQLRQRIDAGDLPGPCPDYTSLWRQCRSSDPENNRPSTRREVAPQPNGQTADVFPFGRQQTLPDPDAASKARLDEAEAALLAVLPPLVEHCPQLLPDSITVDIQHMLKRINTARRAPRLSPREDHDRGEEIFDEQLRYREYLATQVLAFADLYRPSLQEAIAHGLVVEPTAIRTDASVAQPPAAAPTPPQPFTTATGNEWGRHIATEIRPAQGAKISHLAPSDARLRAIFKSAVVQPIVGGLLTPRQALAALKRFARNKETPEDQLYLGTPDRRFVLRYYKASVRTIEYWVSRCVAAIEAAEKAGVPAPSLVDVLVHRQTTDRRKRPKRTPEVEMLVRSHFTAQGPEHTLISAAAVARYLCDTGQANISERTAQAIINETLADHERGIARGGVAASDVLFRSHLHQTSAGPNRCWMLDHSFSQNEYLNSDHPEYAEQVTPNEDLEWPLPFSVEHRNHTGTWKCSRKRGIHVSMIVDACTRRVLAIRLWDRVPTSEMTLSVVYDAVAEFGAPDFLYTDNGGDFRSHLFRERLTAAGIKQVFSIPHTPQGRGVIERRFRSLKEMVMPFIPGYTGARGSTYEAAVEDLLTLPQLEQRVWTILDHYLNHREHSTTHRKPAVHYDEMIGGRGFRGTDPRALVALLPSEVRLRETWGVEFGGLPYWTPQLALVPNGAKVIVHYHPVRWETVHLAVVASDGTTEFLGLAEYYDANNPPPEMAQRQQLEGLLRARLASEDLPRFKTAAERVRTDAAISAAEVQLDEFVISIQHDLERRGQSIPTARLLPMPGSPETGSDIERNALTPSAPVGTQPVDTAGIQGSNRSRTRMSSPKPKGRTPSTRVLVDPLDP